MDIEHFISGTHTFSFDYDQSQPQQLPYDLYDQQSQQQSQHLQNSVHDVINLMVQKCQIIDRPINQIVYQAINQYHLANVNVSQFVKRVKKTKNILKRNRAKSRICINQRVPIIEKRQFMCDQSSTDKDMSNMEKQIKKQRNRISAQISRDRKKNYVTNLEIKNKQLSQQSQSLKMENERLRKQISEKYNENNKQSNEHNKNKTNNKFTRLLVLLGFVFLMYLLKDIFNFKTNKTVNSLKLSKESEVSQQQLTATTVLTENTDIVEQIRNQINQIQVQAAHQGSECIMGKGSTSLKESLIKKVSQIKRKTKQIMLPSNLAANLFQIKNLFRF